MGHTPSGLLARAALAYPVLIGDRRSIMGRTGHSPRPKRFPRTCRFQSMVGHGSNVRDGAHAPSRRGNHGPDGAFAPSETFSPSLPVPINGRPRIKRSGRGECPVPPRLMGHTPSGLLALAALAYPVLLGDGRSIIGRTGHSPRLKRFLRTCRFQSAVGHGSNVRDGANAPSRRG